MPSTQKKPAYNLEYKLEYKQELKAFLVLPRFSCGVKKATALLEQWVKYVVLLVSFLEQLPS